MIKDFLDILLDLTIESALMTGPTVLLGVQRKASAKEDKMIESDVQIDVGGNEDKILR